MIHHALLVCRGGRVMPVDLRLGEMPAAGAPASRETGDRWQALDNAVRALFEEGGDDLHRRVEHAIMRSAYAFCDRNQLQTARLLGISRNVVRARLIEAGEIASGRSVPEMPPAQQESRWSTGPSRPPRPDLTG